MRPFMSRSTEAAVVGLGRPEMLADGAAIGTPAARIIARATGCSGMRMPTVSRPPVMRSGTMALRRRMSVMGPGIKAASSFSAIGVTSAAIISTIARSETCRISGLSDGRPFAS